MDDDDADADLELLRLKRKRAAKAKRNATIKLALVGLGVVAIAVLLVVAFNRSGGRATNGGFSLSLGDETQDMTYLDLLNHLKSKGLKDVWMEPTRRGQLYSFVPEEKRFELLVMVDTRDFPQTRDMVFVKKHADRDAARHYAGSVETGVFQWGRFTFDGIEGSESYLKIKKALTGR